MLYTLNINTRYCLVENGRSDKFPAGPSQFLRARMGRLDGERWGRGGGMGEEELKGTVGNEAEVRAPEYVPLDLQRWLAN